MLPKALIPAILVGGPGLWGCADAFPDLLQGDDVLVGDATPKIDLARCLRADCGLSPPPRTPIPGDEAACDPGEATILEPIQWRSVVRDGFCAGPALPDVGCATSKGIDGVDCEGMADCLIGVAALAPASDKSLWIAGTFGGNEANAPESRLVAAIWLAHEAADGTRLSAALIERESFSEPESVAHDVALAVDERDHAMVVVRRFTGLTEPGSFGPVSSAVEQSLREFTPDGSEVGHAIPIVVTKADAASANPSMIAMHRAGRWLALGQTRFGGGATGIFELETRSMRWVHTRERRLGFHGMVSDAAGAITLLTHGPNQIDSGRIEHYDPAGTLVWERIWTEGLPDGGLSGAALTLGVDGAFWIAASRFGEPTVVHRVAADGSWSMITRLPSPLDLTGAYSWGAGGGGQATLSAQGSLLVDAGSLQFGDDPPIYYLQELSDDLSSCRLYAWPEIGGEAGFRVDAARRLHFVTSSGYGAFQLPEFPTP